METVILTPMLAHVNQAQPFIIEVDSFDFAV
jgi:hypothetical protein